uniref:Uncharacterized protein n=1 Tax=Knipowitschia caucasica TaxID=637954 RepID=A0AAV2K8I6_KNICA
MHSVSESLQKELETLQKEAFQLEITHKEKEELSQKLHYLCEESDQELARQLKHNKSTEDLSEQYNCEIQAVKLKHRKLRMKFENHLCQLIEQQKNLYSVFIPEKLPGEIDSAVNTKGQLLTAEKLKITQINSLEEKIEKWKQDKQGTSPVAVPE